MRALDFIVLFCIYTLSDGTLGSRDDDFTVESLQTCIRQFETNMSRAHIHIRSMKLSTPHTSQVHAQIEHLLCLPLRTFTVCTIRAGSPHFYDVIPMDYVKQFKFQMENLMLDYRIKSCDFDVYDVFKDLGLQYEQSVGVNSGRV